LGVLIDFVPWVSQVHSRSSREDSKENHFNPSKVEKDPGVGDLKSLMARAKANHSTTDVCPGRLVQARVPYFLRVRERMPWLLRQNPSEEVLTLLQWGIQCPEQLLKEGLKVRPSNRERSAEEEGLAESILLEYQAEGAVRQV
jgi:hypothetical protein